MQPLDIENKTSKTKKIIRELIIYLSILVTLAIFMHKEKLIDNIIFALQNPSKFLHPIIYSLIAYLIVATVRFFIFGLIKFFIKKRDNLE